jgi:hypothetical protein
MFDRSTEHRLIGRTVPFLNAGDGRALDDLQGNSFALIRRADSGKADLLVTRLGRQLVDVAIPDDYWTEIERLAGQPVGGAVLVRPDRLVCAIGAPAELLVHLKCMLPGAIEAVGNSQTRKSIVNH